MADLSAVVVLSAPGRRDITLITRDVNGEPLPIALSYVVQLERRGYTCLAPQTIPLLVAGAERLELE